MSIVEVVPRDDYSLLVKTDDGRTGMFDVRPYMDSEAFAPLRDKGQFMKIHNGRYFVEWECGADLSADTITLRWRELADSP
jgi:hypothetical protein